MLQPEELQAPDFFSTISFKNKLLTRLEENDSDSQKTSYGLLIQSSNLYANPSHPQSPSEFSGNKVPNRQNISNTTRKYFTKKEDHMLTEAALKYKQEKWNIIAQYVPGKTPKQCRDRWANYLRPTLHFGPWTENEDQLLVSLVNKYGTHWTKMKSQFPERSANCIKNRWYWLRKNNVRMMTLDKSTASLLESLPDCQASIYSNICESNINIFSHNNNKNDLHNSNTNNDENLKKSPNNEQNEFQNYYFLIKRRNNKKRMPSRKKNKINGYYSEESNQDIFQNQIQTINEFHQNNKNPKNNELITFDADELNW